PTLRLQEFSAQVMQSGRVPLQPALRGSGECLRNLVQPFGVPSAQEIGFRQQAETSRRRGSGAQPSICVEAFHKPLPAFGNITPPRPRPANEYECPRTLLRFPVLLA